MGRVGESVVAAGSLRQLNWVSFVFLPAEGSSNRQEL